MFCRAAMILFLMLFGAVSVNGEEFVPKSLGKTIPDFTLTDFRGKEVSLRDFEDKPIVVVAFLGTDCPLAKLYGPRLQTLSEKYQSKDVAFLGINSNRQDTLTQVGAYARRHGVKFPLLKDGRNEVADLFGAVRTPEVFVLDRSRTVRYYGRIDDQYGIGYVRDAVEQSWVSDSIEALIAGKEVAVKSVEPVGCHIGRVKQPNPDSPVTYSNQIARIFNTHCIECHRKGEIAPFPLTNFDEVVGWAEMIREVVNEKRMPPWHADPAHGKFENDISLTAEQIAEIDLWVRNGAPEGDPAQKPELPVFTAGWQLPREPDEVFAMAEQPYRVQAEGEVSYKYFEVDPKFAEDKYIEAAEIIPGNRAVVHHILINVVTPKDRRFIGAGGGEFLTGYVPGSRFRPLPKGMAKFVPAGSKLRFQVHYTPIGVETDDLSKVGFLYADPENVDKIVITQQILNANFTRGRRGREPSGGRPVDSYIPAGAENHPIAGRSIGSPIEVELLHLMPHMHLRGKAFTYELVPPGGRTEVLLDVPAYDFNWQTAYRLEEPLKLPAGSHIRCVGYFDNSERNLANPDPERDVYWGDQTDDEMMIGYFDVAVPVSAFNQSDLRLSMTNRPRNQIRAAIDNNRVLFKALDKNNDGLIAKEELTNPNHLKAFPKIDVDGDGKITPAELSAWMKSIGRKEN